MKLIEQNCFLPFSFFLRKKKKEAATASLLYAFGTTPRSTPLYFIDGLKLEKL